MKLTPDQIKTLDELSADEAAIERALEVSLNYYSNRKSQIVTNKAKFCRELSLIHNLDLDKKEYTINTLHGSISIIEKDDED